MFKWPVDDFCLTRFVSSNTCSEKFCPKVLHCLAVPYRSSCSKMFLKRGVLKNFVILTEKGLCWSLFLIKLQKGPKVLTNLQGFVEAAIRKIFFENIRACDIIKKGLTQVFFCEYCEIFKNTFFHKTPLVAAAYVSFFSLTISGKSCFTRSMPLLF